ncbi:MAG TPA: GGDEF domain-containing phosphodiesterase [Solirubrobacteraceae bacterium]|nr:GGDEF domain-containing phosphodiesterase [Solirubrobacteraceae bacterium]
MRRDADTIPGLPTRTELCGELEGVLLRAAPERRALALVWLTVLEPEAGASSHHGWHPLSMLHSCAERIAACLADGDVLAHLGGPNFAVLVDSVKHPHEAAAFVHGLLDAFRRPFVGGSQANAAAGVAVYPADADSPEELLQAAERAMRRAAAGKPGQVAFSSPQLEADERRQQEVQDGLGPALEHNEFVLHYQPVLEPRHGDVAAVEALIRWQHPQGALIQPLDFIPTAEDTGQIVAIGEWALMQACRQARAWERAGMPVRMAVNLSARQFSEPDLVDCVARALHETGLQPRLLELELTESMFADPDTSTAILERLHAMGVRVAIDDFGTGFSSLTYLTRFPLDTIKIDRSFVSQATENRDAAAVVSSVITMAHELGLQAVAEGVETKSQERFLLAHGCDLLQGFLHSPPLPALECERWLRERIARPLSPPPGYGSEATGTGMLGSLSPPALRSAPRQRQLVAGARR